MPYKDPEKQKAAKRKYYRRKYAEDPDFVEAERQRKLAHYEANREERLPQMRAYSQEWYAKIEKKRRKADKKTAANGQGRRPTAKKAAAATRTKVARKAVTKKVAKSKKPTPIPAAKRRSVSKPVPARRSPPPTAAKAARPRSTATAAKAARTATRPSARSRSATVVKKAQPAAKRRK